MCLRAAVALKNMWQVRLPRVAMLAAGCECTAGGTCTQALENMRLALKLVEVISVLVEVMRLCGGPRRVQH